MKLLHWLGLLRQALSPQSSPEAAEVSEAEASEVVEYVASVRPDFSLWLALGSDGTVITGTGAPGETQLRLELRALQATLQATPTGRVLWHATLHPVAGIVRPEAKVALERSLSRKGRHLSERERDRSLVESIRSLAGDSLEMSLPQGDHDASQRRSLRRSARALLQEKVGDAPAPVVVATDGSVNQAVGVGAWAWWVSSELHAAGTLTTDSSHAAELEAVAAALESLPPGMPLTVLCDSRSVVEGCQHLVNHQSLPRRQQRESATDLLAWKRVEAAARVHTVSFRWVRSHDGHPANTAADHLARRTMRALARGDAPVPVMAP